MTDPELDLLREMLDEDPGADVFVDVGREFCRREQWGKAVSVLQAGLAHNPDDEAALGLLAQAGVGAMAWTLALESLERLSPTPDRNPDLVKLEILALSGAGQAERAALLAESLVLLHPAMGPIEALLTRSGVAVAKPEQEPPLAPSLDPSLTEDRAEAFVAARKVDRAIRIYRRLAYRNPKSQRIKARLSMLLGHPHDFDVDDLSEELPAPQSFAVPPSIDMPRPQTSMTSATPAPVQRIDTSDEVTDPSIGANGTPTPKRRRSLLRR